MIPAVFAFVIGAAVGSFLNVIADRLPQGKSLVSPRSQCDACEHPLSYAENLPILGFVWLRGRCRHCGARIPLRVPVVEAVTAGLFVAVYAQFGLGMLFVVVAAGVSLMLAVAVIDWEHRLILNRMVLPALLVSLVVAPFWSELGAARGFPGTSGALASFLNSVAAGGGAFLFFALVAVIFPRGMGGGDVKFAAPLGVIVGFPGALVALWISAFVGGVVAVFLLLLTKRGRKDVIPYGPFMSLGGIAVLLAETEIIDGYQSLIDRLIGV